MEGALGAAFLLQSIVANSGSQLFKLNAVCNGLKLICLFRLTSSSVFRNGRCVLCKVALHVESPLTNRNTVRTQATFLQVLPTLGILSLGSLTHLSNGNQ